MAKDEKNLNKYEVPYETEYEVKADSRGGVELPYRRRSTHVGHEKSARKLATDHAFQYRRAPANNVKGTGKV